jgi:hypothetical protein
MTGPLRLFPRAAPGKRPFIAEIFFQSEDGKSHIVPLTNADVVRWLRELARLAEPVEISYANIIRFDTESERLEFFDDGQLLLTVEGPKAVFFHQEIIRHHDPEKQTAVAMGILAAVLASKIAPPATGA